MVRKTNLLKTEVTQEYGSFGENGQFNEKNSKNF